MSTRGFSFRGLVDYVLALKDSLTTRIDNLTANDVGAAKGGNHEINVANFMSTRDGGSDWIIIKTNIAFGSDRIVSLHLEGSGGFGVGYTYPISAKFGWYYYNNTWYYPSASIECPKPIGKSTWHLANMGGKVALIIGGGYYCRFTLSLVNTLSASGLTPDELKGWTCIEASDSEVNPLPNRASYTLERVYNTAFKPTPADIGAVPMPMVVASTGSDSLDSLKNKIPKIGPDGVMVVGKYIDFIDEGPAKDYDVRLTCSGTILEASGAVLCNSGYYSKFSSAYPSYVVGGPPSSYTGGWARGLEYRPSVSSSAAGGSIGFYGGGTTLQRAYIGCGSSPWQRGIWVGADNIPWSGSYRIYHQGYKPTLRDIESDPNARGEAENLMDIIDELRSEIAELKAKVK